MATPFSLRKMTPQTAWLAMIISSAVLFIFGTLAIVWFSSSQNQALVNYEFSVILRGNGDLLNQGNLRGFAENAFQGDSNFYLSAHNTVKNTDFMYGEQSLLSNGQCSSKKYLEYELIYCRENPIPLITLTILSLILLFLITATSRIIYRLGSEMVVSFKEIFDIAHIEYSSKLDFAQAWNIARGMAEQFESTQSNIIRLERDQAKLQLAKQVAHDIRSPVSALQLALSDIKNLNESKISLIQLATNRIKLIADDLLINSKTTSTEPRAVLVKDIINVFVEILEEKKLLFPDIFFKADFESLASLNEARINTELDVFGRIVSNLLNNAIEALDKDIKNITTRGFLLTDQVCFSIVDNGKGISSEVLPKIWLNGASFGKSNGSGLGLFYSKAKIESWGGFCTLESTLNQGTQVSVCLPILIFINQSKT